MTKTEHFRWVAPLLHIPQDLIDLDFVEMVGKLTDRQMLLFSAAASASLAQNDLS